VNLSDGLKAMREDWNVELQIHYCDCLLLDMKSTALNDEEAKSKVRRWAIPKRVAALSVDAAS
jgi:hypothetical protein